MSVIETELNAIAWHLKVAAENQTMPCPLIVGRHVKEAKKAFDILDNFYIIKKA